MRYEALIQGSNGTLFLSSNGLMVRNVGYTCIGLELKQQKGSGGSGCHFIRELPGLPTAWVG